MADIDENNEIFDETHDESETQAHSSYHIPLDKKTQLSGMFQNWFLDYA